MPDFVDAGWVPDKLQFLSETLKRLLRPETQFIALRGHPRAKDIVEGKLKRSQDSIFTVLREPFDAAVSMVNHILTQIGSDGKRPDGQYWREKLGISGRWLGDAIGAKKLLPAIVENFINTNQMCSQLGFDGTLSSAIDTIQRLDINIVLLDGLSNYLKYLGIESYQNENISTKYILAGDMEQSIRLRLYDKIGEDLKLYDLIKRRGVGKDHPWTTL